ncbi:MAG: phosphotransferase [Paludisphaera borealis]|uniref:phosphotransferase family protein n=1 Tax=Paludisphaera borealis TaxID=1387353 RepID=UPI00284BF2A8|nr:phosphotransferase [Paludisphaera borealis]MDR3620568.1 phosphotransferase [Paludisphaera borealis]
MDISTDSAPSQLCGADECSFERGLHSLSRRWESATCAGRLSDLFLELRCFGQALALGSTEVSRRVRLTVEAAQLPERQARELANNLSELPATVRQAVIASIPASLRRLAYAPQTATEAGPAPATTIPPPSERIIPTGDAAPPPATLPLARECASVILLGTYADHHENIQTLERKGFASIRAMTTEQLNEFLDHEVCGVVVARSWWTGIPEAEREDVLKQIIRHSSFAWLKLDTHDLPCVGDRLHQLVLSVRYAWLDWDFCVCDGWRLTQHDLDALERVRGTLANTEAVRIYPAEIQECQARVLIGAAIKHVRQRNFAGTFRLTRVDANFIPGGRSPANIIQMVPDDDGAPLVAKVDNVSRLSDEMNRYRRYVQSWDTALNPQLHYHAGTSLIIFGLVESPDSPGRPAPTLEETLESIFYHEHHPPYGGPSETDLKELINRATQKLRRLNSKASDGACSRKTFIECEPYDKLRRIGINWSIGNADRGGESVFEFVTIARNRVESLAEKVIVHGDVQLRNILVRDGREPHFIDYANCGPGHPCYDLVRLESAVLFYCFRMNGDEAALATLFLDILSGRDEATIQASHPIFCSSITNRVAIHACISCRTAAIEIVTAHGGTEDDYLAMKFVLACQSLFLIHLQAGVVRSQLSALGAFLRTRSDWRRNSGARE